MVFICEVFKAHNKLPAYAINDDVIVPLRAFWINELIGVFKADSY